MMKRRAFFTSGSMIAMGVMGFPHVVAGGSDSAKKWAPVVMAPRHDGCEILWLVDELSKGYLEYGLTKDLGSVERNDGWGLRPAGDRVIKVRLSGLEAGKEYFYRTVTEKFDPKNPAPVKSEIRSFRTLNPEQGSCAFSVWNDTHKHADTLKKLGEITPQSDFLLWNGDVCNDWATEEDIASTVLDANGSGVEITRDHPLFFVRGNHDIRGPQAEKLEKYIAMPSGKPWYAFRHGPVAFICMDTGEDKPDDHPYLFGRVACEPMRKEQAAWLEQVINQAEMKSAPYRVIFCHIPLRGADEGVKVDYDLNSSRSRDLWHDGLVKWGAQVVISGHLHQDGLIPANKDYPYAQMIGGGPNLNSATLIHGVADEGQLVLQCKDMAGKLLHELKLAPLVG